MSLQWSRQVLAEDAFAQLYTDHMKADFPVCELKPFKHLLALQATGNYGAYTFGQATDMRAYACLYADREAALLDYFAVARGYRSEGWGSRALEALLDQSLPSGGLILECDDPAFAENAAEQRIRERRIRFYERLGFLDSGVRATVFTAPFWVMARGQVADARAALQHIYDVFVPDEKLHAKYIHIH